jgi:MFS family permease
MSTIDQIEANPLPGLDRVVSAAAWTSLISASAAWAFDAMDFQIFTLVLFPSVSSLISSHDPGVVAYTGGLIVACKLVALGLGGIGFGILADRIGRARTMMITVLIYSVFAGLSSLAETWWQLAALQAIAGIGIGGEWAAGAALIAESWPERTRAQALVIMQASFAVGFFLAALINLVVGPIGWRFVFLAGAAPALLTFFVRLFVPESRRWLAVRNQYRNEKSRTGAIATPGYFTAIFAPAIRRHTIVGLSITTAMMTGAFAAALLLPIWIRTLVGPANAQLAIAETSRCFMLINVGAIAGYLAAMWLGEVFGRRWSYFVMALGCAAANWFMFTQIGTIAGLLWFAPVFGFFAVGGFATFAIYLPELFATPIRATGLGFCWNVARILTAAGPLATGAIVGAAGSASAAGALITGIYALGLVAIWFGPETRWAPLRD